MVGYSESSGVKGYKLYDPVSGKFIFNRFATFDEEILFACMNKFEDFQNNSVFQSKLHSNIGERKQKSINFRIPAPQSSQNQDLGSSIIWRPTTRKEDQSPSSNMTTQNIHTQTTKSAAKKGDKSDANSERLNYLLQPTTSIIKASKFEEERASWYGETVVKQRLQQQKSVLDSTEKQQRRECTSDYLKADLRGTGCVKSSAAPVVFVDGCNSRSPCSGGASVYRKPQVL